MSVVDKLLQREFERLHKEELTGLEITNELSRSAAFQKNKKDRENNWTQ